jgi:predicted PurR-regulated permease PerM
VTPESGNDKETLAGSTVPPAPAPPPSEAPDPNGPVPPWLRRAIALFFVWAVAVLVAWWLVVKLRSVLLMVLAALFVALAMEPPVNYLVRRRGWRRGAATGVVLFGVIVIGLVFVAAIISIVAQEIASLVDEAPRYLRDIQHFLNRDLGLDVNLNKVIRDLQRPGGPLQDFADDAATGALSVTGYVLSLALHVVTTLVFAFYLTADGPRFRRAICSLLPPKRQRTVLDTWEIAIDKTGGYLYSRGIQAAVSASATWLVLLALGVPYSLALGLWVGVVSQFIPVIGTYIAMVLPVLIAVTRDPIDALIVLGFLVLYQQFENFVLGPRITAHTMNVHPALAIGTVFIGPIGAIMALPATAVIQAVVSAYGQRYEVIPTSLTEEPKPPKRRFRDRLGSLLHREAGEEARRAEGDDANRDASHAGVPPPVEEPGAEPDGER